jgi:5-methylcytosine-specific restriction endonuclease McrA
VTRYCEEHKHRARVHPNGKRLSAHERGYDAWWKAYSKAYLAVHQWCVYCRDQGIATASACVDHIVAPRGDMALFRDPKNHAASCISCNSAKAVREEGAGWAFR